MVTLEKLAVEITSINMSEKAVNLDIKILRQLFLSTTHACSAQCQNNDTVKHHIVKYTIQKHYRIKKGCFLNSLFLCGIRILIVL